MSDTAEDGGAHVPEDLVLSAAASDPEGAWESLEAKDRRPYEVAADHPDEYVVLDGDRFIFSSRNRGEAIKKLSSLNTPFGWPKYNLIFPNSPFVLLVIRHRTAEQAARAVEEEDAGNGGLKGTS